jgi:hypothetical protein
MKWSIDMGETKSRGHEISAEIRGWAIAFAALVVFTWYGCEHNAAQNKVADATANLAEKTGDDQARKVQFDAMQSQLAALTAAETANDEIAIKDYAAKQAAFEQEERGSPSIRVLPELIQSASYNGVREISLDTEITNIGRVMANVRQIKVNVSAGCVAPGAFDKINRTQQLHVLEQQLDESNSAQVLPPTPQDGLYIVAPNPLQLQYDQLHSECPHGLIFALANDSKDVVWTALPDKSWTCNVDMRLAPNASASQIFPYVLTESRYHNATWVRFEAVVTLDTGSAQNFQFIVPLARQSDFAAIVNYKTARYEGSEDGMAAPSVFRPRSPLAPIRDMKTPAPQQTPPGSSLAPPNE